MIVFNGLAIFIFVVSYWIAFWLGWQGGKQKEKEICQKEIERWFADLKASKIK